MKTHIRMICLLLVTVLCLVLWSGCGKQAEPASATTPPITKQSYMLTHVQSGIISYAADEFQATGSLELRSDGTAQLYYADQTEQLLYDNSSMWNPENEDQKHSYSISGKVLTLEYYSETLTFLKK